MAEAKREQFSSPAALLLIVYHVHIITMLKTEKYTRIFAMIINEIPNILNDVEKRVIDFLKTLKSILDMKMKISKRYCI